MNKVFKVKVGTRNRITVPFNCWMELKNVTKLKLSMKGSQYWWDPCVGMTPSLSYRITTPFETGTELELKPNKETNIIKVTKIGPYYN